MWACLLSIPAHLLLLHMLQVVISWMVFMGRLTVDELAIVAGVEKPQVATLTKVTAGCDK